MAHEDRKPARSARSPTARGPRPGAGETEPPTGDRYEPPRILRKRAVARIAQQFSGGGPSASGPILVGDG